MSLGKGGLNIGGNLRSVRPCYLLNHTHYGGLAVVFQVNAVHQRALFYPRYVLQIKRLARSFAGQDDDFILNRLLKAPLITQCIFEGHIAVLTERARGGFYILLCERTRYVGRYQPILFHLIRL